MKNIFIVIAGGIILLSACGKVTNDVVEIELACTINTFEAPVHAISKSVGNSGRLYFGLENGSIVKMEGDKRHVYSGGDKRIIYDIWEHNKDSLFIGTRDGGLKLITLKNDSCVKSEDFNIESKDLNYSVYSIAEDSINRILYFGTSNGLFKMDLKNNPGLVMLERVELGDKKQDGIHKVLFRDSTLYVAGDPGLFISKSPSRFFNPIKGVRVNNVILDNDTIYALTQNSIVKIDNPYQTNDSVYKTIASGEFYSYSKTPDNEEWLLSGRNVFLKKKGITYKHKLPSGITPSSKQVGLMDNDFYYIAYRELLLAFPLRQNTQGLASSVIAVSDRTGGDDRIYFITSDFKLHKYRFDNTSKDKYNSEPMGQLKGLNVHDEIVKFIHTGSNVFFLATKKNLYKIKGNTAECIVDFNKMDNDNDFSALYFSPDEQKLYIGTRRYLGSIACGSGRKVPSEYTIESIADMDTTDLYVVDISGRDDGIYVATLNKGLFQKTGKQGKFEKIWHSEKYGSTYGLAITGKEDLLLNTSEGIIYNDDIKTLSFLDKADIKAIYRVHEDNSSDGIFILYYHGIHYQGLTHSLIEKRVSPFPLFSDIAFSKACIAVKGESCVLGSRLGLFLFDQSALSPITIQEEKDYTTLYIFIMGLLLLIGGAVIYCFYIKKKKQQYRSNKLIEYMDEVNALKSQVSLLVKKEDREALLMKFDDLIGKLLLRKQGEYISGIFVREMKENVNELRTEFFKKALTLNEYIEMSLEEVAQRIEIMKNLPKIEKEEQENLLEEIIEYQKRISVDAEYKTIKHINSLKQKLLILERDLADNMVSCRNRMDGMTTADIEKGLAEVEQRIKNIMSLPKIRTNELEKSLKKIIEDKDKIRTDIEYQTTTQIDKLKEKLLKLENGLADCIAPYSQTFYEQYAAVGHEEKIKSLKEKVDGRQSSRMVKKGCDDFVNAYSQLRKLSFMQKKRSDIRFYAAVLYFIPDIKASTICASLGLQGKQKINNIQKFKNCARKCIEELYKQEPVMREDKIIGLLYSRLGGDKKSDDTSSLSNNAPKSDND